MKSSKIHICLLTSGRVFEIAYGGEEKFTTFLGNWLVCHGSEVTIMGSSFASVKAKRLSSPTADTIEKQGTNGKKVRILYMPYAIYALSRLLLTTLWILKIVSVNLEAPITILHAQDTGYAGLAAVVAGKILRIPIIISSHGIRHRTLESNVKGLFRKILLRTEYNLDKYTIKHANGVIAVSSSIKDYFEKRIKKNIDVIPIPIKLEKFQFSILNRSKIRQELAIDDKTIVVGFIGRFSSEKNLLSLLVSLRDAAKRHPPIKLVLVGTGPLECQLKEYVNKNGMQDKVIFCGVRHDVNVILSSFDIFVLPSHIEGLSTALLEAMAVGLAIVCSNISANRDLLTHNHDALLVNQLSPEEMEQGILLLAKDSSLRSRLGHNAALTASEYNEEKIFPRIFQYYKKFV